MGRLNTGRNLSDWAMVTPFPRYQNGGPGFKFSGYFKDPNWNCRQQYEANIKGYKPVPTQQGCVGRFMEQVKMAVEPTHRLSALCPRLSPLQSLSSFLLILLAVQL